MSEKVTNKNSGKLSKCLIVIPTYNELNNVQKLIPDLNSLYPQADIMIVDDNSPDGTGDFVKQLSLTDNRVKLIQREGKLGLGTAYVRGFKYMLENGYEFVIQMDADYSHNPKDIARFIEQIENYDLVIGSRYIHSANVVNWPLKRLVLSYTANKYAKIITGLPIADSTGGFKCFRRKVLESVNLDNIKSNGYSFQIEMNFISWKKGFKILEIPIVFTERQEGASKMSKKIIREALCMVWKLRARSIFGKLNQ
ncbi:MAG: polyprenol monophosphomannose synthase [Ignavibacteriales bacterium]|nr:polyprenol monophosphomannose synthase [Ignavibacteriales bacterium]